MKKYKLLIFLILLLSICCGTRLYTLTRPEASFPLTLKWSVDLGYSTFERPAYKDGLVFLPASGIISSYGYGIAGSQWYGLDATTGHVVWSQETGQYDFRRCLTTEYLVLSGPWSLKVLKIHTGEIAWEEDYPAYTATCSERAVFSSGVPRDSIYAFDLSTGQELWGGTSPEKSFDGLIYNSERDEIIARHAEDYYLVEAKSGLLKNSFKEIAIPPTDSSWERGSMYVVDRGELFLGGTVLDAKTGQIIHKEERYGSVTPPIVTTDTIYLSAMAAGVVAFDRATYNIKWVYHPEQKVQWLPLATQSPVAILNGIGYVIFSDATLRAFDPETGQELGYWQPAMLDLWRWPICTFPPMPGCVGTARAGLATSEDMLFASFGDGKLYAFGQ